MMRNRLLKAVVKMLFGGRTRRLRFRLMLLFGIILALLYFAPTVVSRTTMVEKSINKSLDGATIEIGRKRLGWFSSVQLDDVLLRDEQGEVLVHLESLHVSRTVFGLLFNRSNLGHVHLRQPNIVVDDLASQTNWESFLAKLLKQPSSGKPLTCRLTLENGKVFIREGEGDPRVLLEGVSGEGTLAEGSVTGQVQATAAGQPDAGLSIEVRSSAEGDTTQAEALALVIKADGFPIQHAQELARRFVADLTAEGKVTGEVQWYYSPTTRLVFNDVRAEQVRLTAPSLLRQDQFHTALMRANGQLIHDGRSWLVQDAHLDAGIAKADVKGSVPLQGMKATSLASWLPERAVHVQGSADVAALVTMLPNALHVQPSLRMTSGDVSFDISSVAQQGYWDYQADIRTSNVVARNGNQIIEWQSPLQFVASLRRAKDMVAIQKLDCRSSFLTASGAGDLRSGSLQASGDLGRLMSELDHFIQLDSRLQGHFEFAVGWETKDGVLHFRGTQTPTADGRPTRGLVVNNFAAPLPGGSHWREDRIDVDVIGHASRQGDNWTLGHAHAVAHSRHGVVEAKLSQPIAMNGTATNWPLQLMVVGDLARWRDRLVGVWGENALKQVSSITGRAEANLQLVHGKEGLRVSTGRLVVRDLDLTLESRQIRESLVDCQLVAGVLKQAPFDLLVDDLTMTTSTVALRARDLHVGYDKSGSLFMEASTGYRADVDRLAGWLGLQRASATTAVRGSLLGQAHITTKAGIITAQLNGEMVDARWARLGRSRTIPVSTASDEQVLWAEPSVRFSGTLNYADSKLMFKNVTLNGRAMTLNADGQLIPVQNGLQLTIDGQSSLDLEKMSSQFQGLLGDSVKLKGQSLAPISFSGQFGDATSENAWRTWKGATRVQWTAGQLFGLDFGESTIEARLQDGVLAMTPIAMQFGGGQLNIAPQLDLTREPKVLRIERAKLVDRVRLSPEICRNWFRYLAPAVADATAADGTFSVSGAVAMPLGDTSRLQSDLEVEIHEARVGPGPVAQELLLVIKQIKAIVRKRPLQAINRTNRDWLVLSPQKIPVKVQNGRVHHENFRMLVGDVPVATYGSVGLDQSLDLVARVPILKEWVEDERLLKTLAGQTVTITIRGTVTRPRIDKSALRQLGSRTLENAASKLLQEQLDRGLRKLLGRE